MADQKPLTEAQAKGIGTIVIITACAIVALAIITIGA